MNEDDYMNINICECLSNWNNASANASSTRALTTAQVTVSFSCAYKFFVSVYVNFHRLSLARRS
jgi:hypothetical protein